MAFPIHIIAEFAALVGGLVVYKNLTHPFKTLVYFLIFIVLVEIAGYVLGKIWNHNHALFNITVPLSILYYSYLFACLLVGIKTKWFILIGTFCFLVFALLNLFFFQGFNKFNTYTIIIGSFLQVIFSASLLYQIMLEDKEDYLWKNPYFWLGIGLLFSFSGTLLTWTIFHLNIEEAWNLVHKIIKSQVYVRYLCILFSFLCFYKVKSVESAY